MLGVYVCLLLLCLPLITIRATDEKIIEMVDKAVNTTVYRFN